MTSIRLNNASQSGHRWAVCRRQEACSFPPNLQSWNFVKVQFSLLLLRQRTLPALSAPSFLHDLLIKTTTIMHGNGAVAQILSFILLCTGLKAASGKTAASAILLTDTRRANLLSDKTSHTVCVVWGKEVNDMSEGIRKSHRYSLGVCCVTVIYSSDNKCDCGNCGYHGNFA